MSNGEAEILVWAPLAKKCRYCCYKAEKNYASAKVRIWLLEGISNEISTRH